METLFNSPSADENNDLYNRLYEKWYTQFIREYIDSIWKEYKKYADKHFATEFPKNTNQRLWEMFLTIALSRKNDISSTLIGKGPDITINKDKKYFIEAVCPTSGIDSNNKPDLPIGTFGKINQGKLELRIQNAISEKMSEYEQYIKSGLLVKTDPFIIAISLADFHETSIFSSSDNIPLVISSIYPIGSELATIDLKSGEFLGFTREYKTDNINDNAKPVSKMIFANCNFNNLSGIIFSDSSFNMPVENLYNELFLVKNENALNKINNNFGITECLVSIVDKRINITYEKNA